MKMFTLLDRENVIVMAFSLEQLINIDGWFADHLFKVCVYKM